MMDALENAGFKSMHIYDEGHSHFSGPWTYLVCFKDYESRASWYKAAPELDIEMHKRLYKTKSGRPTLLYFDAPTMMGYQLPSRAQETAHCRREDKQKECDKHLLLDTEFVNVPVSHLKAQKSSIGQYSGRGLFAAQDISKNSILAVDGSVKSFQVLPSTVNAIENLLKCAEARNFPFVESEVSGIYNFMEGYGYGDTTMGKLHYYIDSMIVLFCNHGCNGTYNVGMPGDEYYTEMNVDSHHAGEVIKPAPIFSPINERHMHQHYYADSILRDIKKGEEILCNYLDFIGASDSFEEDVMDLRAVCTGGMGEVTTYELN